MEPIISIEHLYFTYEDEVEALRDITLDILPREVFVLFGPSRSGKTTLLRLLNRLSDLKADCSQQGEIEFKGKNIFDPDVIVSDLRREISMVFAVPSPLPGSIFDNLTYGLKMAGIRDAELHHERVKKSLKQAGLWDEVKDRLHQSAFALSGGQQQRLCIARSLALEPEVILLDNPTSGLDPLSTGVVEDSLQELKKHYCIIMVPHSVQQAARVADRAGFMLDGELIEVARGATLFTRPQDQRTEDYITGRFG